MAAGVWLFLTGFNTVGSVFSSLSGRAGNTGGMSYFYSRNRRGQRKLDILVGHASHDLPCQEEPEARCARWARPCQGSAPPTTCSVPHGSRRPWVTPLPLTDPAPPMQTAYIKHRGEEQETQHRTRFNIPKGCTSQSTAAADVRQGDRRIPREQPMFCGCLLLSPPPSASPPRHHLPAHDSDPPCVRARVGTAAQTR